MSQTITLDASTEIGSFHRLASGVSSHVHANEDVAVVSIGVRQHEFTSASDLRTLAAKLLAAADVVEGI
jgi:alkaline phosphatase